MWLRECLSLLLPVEGSRDIICVKCEQVDDLLSYMVELEEAERLRIIRECEEIEWWSDSLPYLQDRHWGETSPNSGGCPVLTPLGRGKGFMR